MPLLYKGITMNTKTKADYLKLATHFIQVRLLDSNIQPTERSIRQALIAIAIERRPGYWRRLRCALVAQQRDAGFTKTADKLKTVVNPVTNPDSPAELRAMKKPKQKRCKTVKKEEHMALKQHFENKKDFAVVAALETVRILGCRPAEIMGLKLLCNNQVLITGVKKTEDGKRGLDRTVTVTEDDYNILSYSRGALFDEVNFNRKKGMPERAMHRIQHRLATATKNLWPRRKHRITLYSYRHLMGCDLKASGMNRTEVAAIMGHQSVDSVNVYGNSHTSQRQPVINASQQSVDSVRKTSVKTTDYKKSSKAPSRKQQVLNSINQPI